MTAGIAGAVSPTDTAGLAGLRWDWAISSGATVVSYPNNGPSVTHTFNAAGSWTIAVTATDLNGVAVTAFSFMTVQDPVPLEASFGPPVVTGLDAAFVGASTGPAPDSWSWNFGDGGVSNLQSPTHTYAASGSYTVTLVVGSGLETDDFTRVVTIP